VTKFNYMIQRGNLDYNDLLENLHTDQDRNQVIVNEVKRDWLAGRCCLVTTTRRAHVELLVEMLEDAGIDDVNRITGDTNANKDYSDQLLKLLFSGKTRCIVATVQAVKRGANLNPIDRLHLTTPLKKKDDLEQLIGRIRRKHSSKSDCELVYYIDHLCGYLRNIFNKEARSVFRKLKVPRYLNEFVA
jgi:superfamily II DNA or RNA helicase